MDRRSFFKKMVPVGQEGNQSERMLNDATPGKGMAAVRLFEEICFAHKGSVCFSCREACPEDAIVFAGMFKPIIVEEKCTGCDLCISVCPSSALASGNHSLPNSEDSLGSSGSHVTGLNDLLA